METPVTLLTSRAIRNLILLFIILFIIQVTGQTASLDTHAPSVPLTLDNATLRITFDPVSTTWSCRDIRTETWVITHASASLVLDSSVYSSAGGTLASWSVSTTSNGLGTGNRLTIDILCASGQPRCQLQITLYDGPVFSIITTWSDINQPGSRLIQTIPFTTSAAFPVTPPETLRIIGNGFDSWDPCPSVEWPIDTADYRETCVSNWSAWIHSDTGNNNLALVSPTCTRFSVLHTMTCNGNNLAISTIQDGDSVSIDGDPIQSELTVFSAWQGDCEGMTVFGDRLSGLVSRPSQPLSLCGWSSWYAYGTAISEHLILDNAVRLMELFGEYGLTVIRVDWGWETAWGDWTATDRFPDGIAATGRRIRDLGCTPGLWCAPFSADSASIVFQNHPEWFIRNAAGDPKCVGYNYANGAWAYAFDLTHPEAAAQVRETTGILFADETGVAFLDFLTHGCAGERSIDGLNCYTNPGSTRGDAFHLGKQGLELAVPNAYRLACGAPIGFSTGSFHAMRIASDATPQWSRLVAAADTIGKRWWYRHFWDMDPDVLLARSPLTPDEAQSWCSLVALAGDTAMLGDPWDTLTNDRIQLLRHVIPAANGQAVPLDVLTRSPSRIWRMDKHGGRYLLLVNWSDAPWTIDLEKATIDAESEPWAVFDYWRREPVAIWKSGPLPIKSISPHACRLLHMKPLDALPIPVTTSRHAGGDDRFFDSVSWDPDTGTWQGQADLVPGDPTTFYFAVPDAESWFLSDVDIEASGKVTLAWEPMAEQWIRITMIIPENAMAGKETITWRARFIRVETLDCCIELTSQYFSPGDIFHCRAHVVNAAAYPIEDVGLVVILDVFGALFWAPSFSSFDSYSGPFAPGETMLDIVPAFIWPGGAGQAEDIRWYAAITDAAMTQVYGSIDIESFGWGP
ncbi:alpha-galactosidase [bacterium]|nr:alpha-galactosidase [candidate division CSSED10-310 bacterium]